MKNLSFKGKLLSMCFVISLMSFIVFVFALNGFRIVERRYGIIVNQSMESLSLVNEVFLNFREVRINLRSLGLSGITEGQNREFIDLAILSINKVEALEDAYVKIPFVSGQKELHEIVIAKWSAFKEIGSKVIALNKLKTVESKAELFKIFLEDCPRAANDFAVAVNNLKAFHIAQVASDKNQRSRQLLAPITIWQLFLFLVLLEVSSEVFFLHPKFTIPSMVLRRNLLKIPIPSIRRLPK